MKKRLPSTRVYIKDILEGFYVKSEGDFEPNYLITKDARKIYRAKIVGTVVREPIIAEDETYGKFQVDDGTGVIWVLGFRDDTKFIRLVKRGDMVQLIGKIAEWRDDKQILVEGVSKVDPNMWILHRYEALRDKVEHIKKARLAFEIYNTYGVTAKAKVIAKNKGISEDLLSTIDELYGIIMEQKAEEAAFEEELFEEEAEESSKDLEEVKKAVLEILRSKGTAVSLKFIQRKLQDKYDPETVEEAIRSLLAEGEIFEPEVGYYQILE
ncbi:OB-fold nucleic acid binding domain-containing protein [Thermococcus aggregans]|uniref:OB-fold nucleic acid binding domain-containing protein n=1 Tax=Thermococcus aggregans TaxID=110163 RepID=A0A9E7SNP3_THEAG|nr:OB-fold nucleic acid binding domain-containing protein [Thermococcus aggregans]USS40509.1 OB-fold nucleic acid binding domain-containing protein [Thermococcus aggregans]